MALPTKPSHTTTSISPPLPRPARMSRPSTLPTYRIPGVCFSSWCASLTTALPFSSSSPTFNSPTPGLGRPITSRAYTEPRWANPTSSRASQSTLAPPSMTSTGRPAVGNCVPMAARATPSCTRSSSVAAAMTAPVLLAAVVAAGRAHVVRPLQITAARARLERDVRRLVVGAAGAFLPFGGPSLGYGHGIVLCSVAGLAFEGGEGLPAGIAGRRTAAGARIQVLAAARAQPAPVLPAYDPLRRRQQQLLSHRGPQVDLRGVARQGVAVRVLQGVGILRKQGANVRHDRHGDRRQTATTLPRDLRPQGSLPVESSLSRRVQSPGDPHRPGQDQPESLEQRVCRPELGVRGCGTAGQLRQVDLQLRPAKLNPCGT